MLKLIGILKVVKVSNTVFKQIKKMPFRSADIVILKDKKNYPYEAYQSEQ
jgi:hypothetical protein